MAPFALALLLLAAAAPARAAAPAPLAPPLDVLPLPSVRITGGYGEVRSNHVHAGIDLSTGGHVGAAVRAPLAGAVERVRVSGIGYGRSLYLRASGGRLLVFGHLDAFAPALAAWVDSLQRASGQYEQDLWPPAGRFRFASGDTVAWSGQSGAGPPHLHVEIRHEDFALDPLRAGITQAPDTPPALAALTLEPLDERSWVARHASPRTSLLRAAAETLVVEGSVCAIVTSHAGLPGVPHAPAWSTSAEWAGATIEARLDSISWAGEMAELDLVVERDGARGQAFILRRPPGVHPRFLETSGSAWDGVITVRAGDAARPLVLRARDANGLETQHTVWLRGPRAEERGPEPRAHGTGRRGATPQWTFDALPAGRLRVRLAGTPAGLSAVRIGFGDGEETPATWADGAWTAVLEIARVPQAGAFTARGAGADGREWALRAEAGVWLAGADQTIEPAEFAQLALAPANVFERGVIVARTSRPPEAHAQGLAALGPELELSPARLPLRHPAPLSLSLPAGATAAGADVYRRSGLTWEPLRASPSPNGRWLRAEVSALGSFAVFRDDVAPVVTLVRPARVPPAAPYPRWELVARVVERGSGVDAARSAFEIDGERVPSEWDPEAGELRWRPLRAPAAGPHAVRVRVTDRAGHPAEITGRFVLDSARR